VSCKSLSFPKRIRRRRSKSGVSETIATIILIAATVVIGLVAIVWANSASISSENNLGSAYGHDVTVVSERFTIAYVTFGASNAVVGIYNSGNYPDAICQISYNDLTRASGLQTYKLGAAATKPPFCPGTGTAGILLPVATLVTITVPSSGSLNPVPSSGDLTLFKAYDNYSQFATFQVVR
jgi:hypothetical protein